MQLWDQWGPAKGGLRILLRADKREWKADETPTLQLDLKNVSDKPISYLGMAELECRLKIDGKWYGTTKLVQVGAQLKRLAANTDVTGALTIRLDNSWAQLEDPDDWPMLAKRATGEALVMQPGKHEVEVTFQPSMRLRDAAEPTTPVSNRVELTIHQAEANK